jgi:hypothetical protein
LKIFTSIMIIVVTTKISYDGSISNDAGAAAL